MLLWLVPAPFSPRLLFRPAGKCQRRIQVFIHLQDGHPHVRMRSLGAALGPPEEGASRPGPRSATERADRSRDPS